MMQCDEAGAGISLRPFSSDDIAALGILFRASRVSMQLFKEPYTAAEHMGYIAGLSVGCTITVAAINGQPVGFLSMASKPDEDSGLISHLFVHPDHHRQGVGKALLQDALKRYPRPIELWCFEANRRARTFYEANGFVAAERTDGAQNNENLPDIRYVLV